MSQYGPGDGPPPKTIKVKARVRKIRPKPTPPTQAAQAKAQGAQYASQGKAVEKQANVQKQAVRVRLAQVKDTKGASDLARVKQAPKQFAKVVELPTAQQRAARQATVLAPALKVLDQTTRPVHAIAGGARAAIKGENIPTAVKRGAQLKDRYLFGDALRAAGVKGPIANIAGFGLDVVADPTTYTTFGAGAVARHAAEKAAADATKKAVKAGMSPEGAQTVAKVAARRAETAAVPGKGIAVKMAGHELPGVRRGSAAVVRAVKAPVRKVAPTASKAVPAKAREVAREVRPLVRPAGASEAEFQGTRQAARKARATVNNAEARAQALARHLHKTLPADQHQAVINAIERNDLSKLTPELAASAHDLRSALKGAYRQGRRAGTVTGSVGNQAEWLTSADLKKVRRTVKAEPKAQRQRLTDLQKREAKARGNLKLATREGELQATRKVVVARERALANARVSVAKTKRTPALAAAERQVRTAEQQLARLRRAHRKVKAHPDAIIGAVHAASRREQITAAKDAIKQARAGLIAERRRITGVAPKEQDALLRAVANREAVRAAPPMSKRAQKALVRADLSTADVETATRRVQAAKTIPTRGLTETHEQYLKRLVAYAKQHDLRLLERRAAKLLETKPTNVAKGYFPHDFNENVLKKLGLQDTKGATTSTVGSGPSRTVSRITSGYKRTENRMLSTVNPEREAAGQVPFSTDVPLVALNQLKQSARATSQGQFAQDVAKLGRSVKDISELKPHEGLYKLGYKGKQFGLHEVQGVPKKPTGGGQYVALDRNLLEEMQGATQQIRAGSTAGRAIDQVTGKWKRLATATPGFHIRNVIGDTQQAYLAAPGQQLPRNVAQAGKAVRRASQQARELRPSASTKTIKVAGTRQPIDEFLKGARENGVLDAGYIARELRDLTGQPSAKAKRVRKGTGQTVERWMANRENLMRLATYKAGLDRGMSAAQAADHANLFHVDYGELSDLERKALRRAFPFYTWTARTLPVTAKTLVTHPGKYANLEKAREETGQAFTGETEQQQRSRMTLQQQRQLPFVIKGPNGISASLPATLLNELPTGASGKDFSAYLDELGRFGFQMLNPAAKIPIELRTGVSTFTRQPIENPKRPLVAAPAWVQHLPDGVKKKLGVTPSFISPKTGKKTWGWRGKADYWSHQIPGAPQQISTLASGGRPGQPASTSAAIAGALGVRVDPLGKQAQVRAQDIQKLKQLSDLNRRAGELNQQGVNSANATPEYRQLRAKINALTKQLDAGKPKVRRAAPSVDILGGPAGGPVDILK